MEQEQIFFWFAMAGGLFGGLYAGLEGVRKKLLHRRFVIYIEDGLFVLFLGCAVYGLFFYLNQGELRGYGFLGFVLGWEMVWSVLHRIWRKCRKRKKKSRRKSC